MEDGRHCAITGEEQSQLTVGGDRERRTSLQRTEAESTAQRNSQTLAHAAMTRDAYRNHQEHVDEAAPRVTAQQGTLVAPRSSRILCHTEP